VPEPELQLRLRAVVPSCHDAGVDPSDVDAFVSYGSEPLRCRRCPSLQADRRRDVGVELKLRTGRDLHVFAGGLQAWMRANVVGAEGATVVNARYVESGGSANETVLADLGGCASTLPASIVVRLLVPSVQIFLGVDLRRQALVMQWVAERTAVPVPAVLGVEATGKVLGAPFLIAERIDGVAFSDYPSYNASGFLHALPVAKRQALWRSAVDTMSHLHTVDASSLADPLRALGGASDLDELVAYTRALYEWVAEVVAVPQFDEYVDWLELERPTDAPSGLSWGDARPGNMLFRGSRCVAVLDWELVSLGGPLIDLGWWLLFDSIHTVDMGLARVAGLGDRDETVARWIVNTGYNADALPWYEVRAHVVLGLTRAKVFAERRRLGLPVPADDDPRSVIRLTRRVDELVG
jgi:aminoglycoside phosphotransferase (APT) family kinase protein